MNQTWFLRAPVDNHKLVNFLQSMVKSADLPSDRNQKLTNTSVQKALCQKLLEANAPDTQAIHITGHKNASPLSNYRKLNNHQQASLSHMLADFKGSTNSNTSTSTSMPLSQNTLTKQETKTQHSLCFSQV